VYNHEIGKFYETMEKSIKLLGKTHATMGKIDETMEKSMKLWKNR
jgi:hypothetical protein